MEHEVLGAPCVNLCVGVLAKLALREVPPFTFVWLQIAIGGSLLTLYTFQWRGERIPKGSDRQVWADIIWTRVGNFTIVRVLFMYRCSRSSPPFCNGPST